MGRGGGVLRSFVCLPLCVFFGEDDTGCLNDVMSDCAFNAACKLSVFSPGHQGAFTVALMFGFYSFKVWGGGGV